MKILSLQEKIQVLENTLLHLTCGYGSNGLCIYVSSNLNKHGISSMSSYDIPLYIPEFSRENAIKLSEIYQFETPSNGMYWWFRDDYGVRVTFLKSLIKELSKQLK